MPLLTRDEAAETIEALNDACNASLRLESDYWRLSLAGAPIAVGQVEVSAFLRGAAWAADQL